jgi:hypothetical protein
VELSACIVLYNDLEEGMQAAASILEHTLRYPITLYLVDNASPDGTGKQLPAAVKEQLHPNERQKVQVICRDVNGGFGVGNNMVLPYLTSDIHFLLNPDILLKNDILSDMADWVAEHPGTVMARPALRFPNGQPQVLPLRKCSALALLYRQAIFLKFLKPFNDHYVMAECDLSKPTEIEFCTGSFAAVTTKDFCAVGGFDEKYFMYVEDADLTQKMRARGKVYLLPQFEAVHEWHRAPHGNFKYFTWQLRSMMRYFRKWGFRL